VAVHIVFLANTSTLVFAILRTKDGTPSTIIAGDQLGDEAWSSTGRYIGYTITTPQGAAGPRVRAIVRDAETGDVVLDQDGRFAGWSPDGLWTYIARPEGLFARRIAGGDLVRFSPYGVVVSTTKP